MLPGLLGRSIGGGGGEGDAARPGRTPVTGGYGNDGGGNGEGGGRGRGTPGRAATVAGEVAPAGRTAGGGLRDGPRSGMALTRARGPAGSWSPSPVPAPVPVRRWRKAPTKALREALRKGYGGALPLPLGLPSCGCGGSGQRGTNHHRCYERGRAMQRPRRSRGGAGQPGASTLL